jgi:hypothetical protein
MVWLHSMVNRVVAYSLSLIHPYTVGRSLLATVRGIGMTAELVGRYVGGRDKPELKMSNPTQHHAETVFRRYTVVAIIGVDLVLWRVGVHYLGSPRGLALWVLAHLVLFFLVGRNGPVMTQIQTPWMAGEARIKQVVDDITSSPASKKAEQRTEIIRPVARLASNKGYEVTVRVAELADPDKLETGAKKLAQKMRVAKTTVFVFPVKQEASAFRLLFLDSDPWDAAPSASPLVSNPRPVNLWREDADLGTLPDSSSYTRRLVEEGDGGGMLAGGAPRRGKTVLIGNLLIWIILHTGSRLHLIDGKAVDFEPLRHVSETFIADPDLTDRALLAESIKVLKNLKTEINRRRKILLPLGVGHVTEELCDKYGMKLEWLVIDELAVLTEDVRSIDKKGVEDFIELMQWIVRMGPAFGVFVILATQRPSDKSVPVAIRDLIIFRAALYIASFSGSQAILGKAGPSFRADWLDPEQKGVALITGTGPVRMHLVKLPDLQRVADFALALRAGGQVAANVVGYDRPEPVRSMLLVMDAELAPKEMPTWALLAGLAERGIDHSAMSLGAALTPFGVTSRNVGPNREKGYRRAELEQVPQTALTGAQTPLDPARRADPSGPRAADPSGPGAGEQEDGQSGSPMAANYEPEDGS